MCTSRQDGVAVLTVYKIVLVFHSARVLVLVLRNDQSLPVAMFLGVNCDPNHCGPVHQHKYAAGAVLAPPRLCAPCDIGPAFASPFPLCTRGELSLYNFALQRATPHRVSKHSCPHHAKVRMLSKNFGPVQKRYFVNRYVKKFG